MHSTASNKYLPFGHKAGDILDLKVKCLWYHNKSMKLLKRSVDMKHWLKLTTLNRDEVIFYLREKILKEARQDCHVCNNCKSFRETVLSASTTESCFFSRCLYNGGFLDVSFLVKTEFVYVHDEGQSRKDLLCLMASTPLYSFWSSYVLFFTFFK